MAASAASPGSYQTLQNSRPHRHLLPMPLHSMNHQHEERAPPRPPTHTPPTPGAAFTPFQPATGAPQPSRHINTFLFFCELALSDTLLLPLPLVLLVVVLVGVTRGRLWVHEHCLGAHAPPVACCDSHSAAEYARAVLDIMSHFAGRRKTYEGSAYVHGYQTGGGDAPSLVDNVRCAASWMYL